MKVVVDIIEILDNAHLVSVPREETHELLVIHAAEDGPFANLETIDVQNWKNRARLGRVDVFDRMPRAKPSATTDPVQGATYVAVGPLSASPSPITQVTIKSGLSMTAPNDTESA